MHGVVDLQYVYTNVVHIIVHTAQALAVLSFIIFLFVGKRRKLCMHKKALFSTIHYKSMYIVQSTTYISLFGALFPLDML